MIGQMAIAIALPGFDDLGCSVTPTFLFRNRNSLQLSPHCPKPNNKSIRKLKKISRYLSTGHRILPARVTVEWACGVLKGRWRILLKRMDNRFINIPVVMLTCCILPNFCQEAGELDDHEILRRVIEREYLQSRCLHHAVRNPAAQAIHQAIVIMSGQLVGYTRNTTVYCFVLLYKHMHAKPILFSMKSEQFMNRIKNKEICNIHQ